MKCHSDEDVVYMQRAIHLAQMGGGAVSPNPMVGAVVVVQGRVLGEGYHRCYGEAHAEVNAIDAVEDKSLLAQATIYVTLEPCSHWGKTPPCCDLIIRHCFRRVVVGCVDPYHEVCGGGIARMVAAGIEVEVGVLEAECRELNKRFFTVQTQGRPYVILKWAQTADGALGAQEQPPRWMTGPDARAMVHTWRAQEDAIMVGRKTVQTDNPSLTVRDVPGRNPLRVVLDRELVLSEQMNVFNSEASTLLITDRANVSRARLKFAGSIGMTPVGVNYAESLIKQVLAVLVERRIHSLFVEGGAQLLSSFIAEELWDEARIFESRVSLDELYDRDAGLIPVMAPRLVDAESVSRVDSYEAFSLSFFRRHG